MEGIVDGLEIEIHNTKFIGLLWIPFDLHSLDFVINLGLKSVVLSADLEI